MVDALLVLGVRKLEVMDEILLWVMDEMVEVLHLLQNVEHNQNLMVIDEIRYMVMDEIELTLLLEVGAETDIIIDALVETDDIVYIELEVMDETELTEVIELRGQHLELIEEIDETVDIEQQVVEQLSNDVTLGIRQEVKDETLGDECMDYEYLYEVTE